MSIRCRSEGPVPRKTRKPDQMAGLSRLWVPDDVLLSHGIHRTIIGAESFHGPVRNGKGWDQLAMVVRRSLLSARVQLAASAGARIRKK
jgi:hypothetical protein